MTAAATEVVRRFAAALAARDETAARACASAWVADRDGPARLYNQLVRAPVSLDVVGDAQAGTGTRAAQAVGIVHGGQVVERQMLLCEGEPMQITGVATSAAHVGHFLAGTAPAVIAWADLVADPDARAAAEALASTLVSAAGAEPIEAGGDIAVIAYLASLVAGGARIEVVDARRLPELGRSVVEARVVRDGGEPEAVFLYLDSTGWRAQTPFFSATTFVAP